MERGTGAKAARIAQTMGKTPLTVGSLPLSWASPFSGPHIAQKVTKSQFFCKACSFPPKFVCSEAHGFSPDKPRPSRAGLFSLPLLWLGKEANHLSEKQNKTKNTTNPYKQTNKQIDRKKETSKTTNPPSEFLFLCLGLPH